MWGGVGGSGLGFLSGVSELLTTLWGGVWAVNVPTPNLPSGSGELLGGLRKSFLATRHRETTSFNQSSHIGVSS